ncbi:MAG: leucine--tRNA ligase [Candidatus Kapaibacterium sp.]
MASYPFSTIEPKWQQYWEEHNTNSTTDDYSKPKYYVLDMFPYPSGTGLHMGHPEGYTATDIVARFKKMKGFNVLHPMGFDAFGLPTEQYSMKTGIHPIDATEKNVDNFKRQLRMLGLGYDWSREINTTHPQYYKWTQWIFLKIYNSWYDRTMQKARPIEELPIPPELTTPKEMEDYKDSRRLAFNASIPVNWCEGLGTVLANEEVDEWIAKGFTVERRPMRQLMLRITEYADRLLEDLELVDWPNSTKEMQKHWIGKSTGAEITFQIDGTTSSSVTVFTTRPDTVFGATYLVLAPEHPLVDQVTAAEQSGLVAEYRKTASLKSDLERTELAKEKTGVFTGGYAINPASSERIPIWIADYVLAHYGTGAIMAVPGHDERDFAFASAFHLPIVRVVTNGTDTGELSEAYTDDGVGMNSANAEVSLNNLATHDAKTTIIQWLEKRGIGRGTVQFRLRDWLFSRQRYWGEPVPILYFDDGTRRALDPDELPLVLPQIDNFKPSGTGESPLATVDSWVSFTDPKTGKHARYETNTMPQWAGSCWYYLRYLDTSNTDNFCAPEKEQYWMGSTGVDLYVGGAEHAVLHLLYARFWHKVLYDYGLVSSKEPFARLFHQGLILSEDGTKMSKSIGKSVSPDAIVAEFGADALRVFEMFMGPLEASKPWATKGVEGVLRFLNRVWRLMATEEGSLLPTLQDIPLTTEQEFVLHSTIKKVGDDIETLSLNTAVSQMMIFVNEFTQCEIKPRRAMEAFLHCLAPFAPHIAEELWQILGHSTSIFLETFPVVDESKLVQSSVEIVLQVNSKIKSKAVVPVEASEEELEGYALADAIIQKNIEGKIIRKKIIVKGKLVNFIVG